MCCHDTLFLHGCACAYLHHWGECVHGKKKLNKMKIEMGRKNRKREREREPVTLTRRANNIVLKIQRLSTPYSICSACSFFSACSFHIIVFFFCSFSHQSIAHSLSLSISFVLKTKCSMHYVYFSFGFETLDANSCCQQNERENNNRMHKDMTKIGKLCMCVGVYLKSARQNLQTT